MSKYEGKKYISDQFKFLFSHYLHKYKYLHIYICFLILQEINSMSIL